MHINQTVKLSVAMMCTDYQILNARSVRVLLSQKRGSWLASAEVMAGSLNTHREWALAISQLSLKGFWIEKGCRLG